MLNGSFTVLDPGNRALRYFVGFGAGRSKLDSRWTVANGDGDVVGECRVHGGQVLGVFGGSFQDVEEKAAARVVEFVSGGR